MPQKVRLSKRYIDSLKPKADRYLVWDTVQRGLVLRVNPSGAKRFFAYLRDGQGKARRPKLADYDPATTDIDEIRRMVRDTILEIEKETIEADQKATGGPEHDLLIDDAFSRALKRTKRGEQSRADWRRDQKKFTDWLNKHYPGVTRWRKLTRAIVTQYLSGPLGHRSPNGKRLAMQPIIQTAGYMEREHQVPNVTGKLGIGSETVRPTATVYIRDLVEFLAWLRDRDPELEIGAGLQGLAGLQMMEALRLSWRKVDLKRGLIEISGQVKNRHRERLIPMPALLLDILKRADRRAREDKVVDLDGPVIPTPTGAFFSEGADSWKNYSRRMQAAMRFFNPKLDWTPKDLRNCILTLGDLEGFSGPILEQYVGHKAQGVTARHYIPRLSAVSAGEREAIDEAMKHLRRLVVDHIDRAAQKAVAGKEGGAVAKIEEGRDA